MVPVHVADPMPPILECMMPKVLLAEPRGFCAGVEMAIKALTWMVQTFEPPVYCYHEIVHNAAVVDAFERAGVVFVDDVAEVPNGRPVMLSAHGSAPEVVAAAESRSAVTIDAVCPLVTKVHHEMRRMSDQGYTIIYVGHEGHDEAIGAIAEAPGAATLVDPVAGLGAFEPTDPGKVALLAQTTLGLFEWEGILTDAGERYPSLQTARKSDLCYATTNRQTAILRLAESASVILVVGSENSSNTQALVRVARMAGVRAHRVDGPEDVDPTWFAGDDIARVTDEDEYFPLPPRLRTFVKTVQALVEGAFAAPNPGAHGLIEDDRGWDASEALALLGV